MFHSPSSLNGIACHHGGSLPHDGASTTPPREARLKSACLTSRDVGLANLRLPSSQLMCMQHLLTNISFAKSTMHAKLNPKSPHYNSSLPAPVCLPSSRIPFRDAVAVDARVEARIKGVTQ
jgi:hypothetical protein